MSVSAEGLRKNVGLRFAELRRARGMTQEELATKASFTTRYIAAIENGERNMRLDSLAFWSKFFGVEPASFFEAPTEAKPKRGRPKSR